MDVPDSMKGYATDALKRAIEVMRDACDDAEHAVGATLPEGLEGDLVKSRRVMNALTWGLANATQNVETALAHVERWTARAASAAKGGDRA